MQNDDVITVQIELSDEQAWALAQLVKRLGWRECWALAEEDDVQTWQMLAAAERIRAGLAAVGYAPR